jgi:hypothetical protein
MTESAELAGLLYSVVSQAKAVSSNSSKKKCDIRFLGSFQYKKIILHMKHIIRIRPLSSYNNHNI